jgi:hypothetical protein
MFGLVVLIAAALYCLVMFLSVRGAWRKGLAIGGSQAWAFRYAALAFLAVYLPVFWDHIPTLVVHRAMCAKDAGFTAYVDAKQWHARNAEAVAVVNRLPRNEREASIKAPKTHDGFDRYSDFGGLLRNDYKYEAVVSWLTVGRTERRVVEEKTGKVLAIAVDYGAGGPSRPENLRWWLRKGGCFDPPPNGDPQSEGPTSPTGQIRWFKYALKGDQS